MNDPTVIKETASYIRVIIRRPHTYFFLRDKFGTAGGAMKGTMTGVSFDDGPSFPIPGIYILNAEGIVESQVGLGSVNAKTDLLGALRGR